MNLRRIFLGAGAVLLTAMFACGIFMMNGSPSSAEKRPGTTRQQEPSQMSHTESGIRYDNPVNLLILGLDQEGTRTDTILFLNFNPMTSRLNILSIERDTQVMIDKKRCKINALYAMGKEEYIKQVTEEITGLPVHYCITLNFKGFKKIIDVLGGVEFEVPFDMNYDDPTQDLHIHLKKGEQLLDGDKAEQLVRYRKGNKHGEGYVEGDVGRVRTQQKFLKALISQKLKLKYLSKVGDLFEVLSANMRTDVSLADVKYYLPGLTSLKEDNIHTYTMPGDSSYENGIWYYFYDEKKTKAIIDSDFSK